MKLNQIEEYVWELPKKDDMKVPGRIYGDQQTKDHLIKGLQKDWSSLKQVRNVASLPGIQKAAMAMPDIHPGYGFPIGGVGAFDAENGIISAAGVGFDCNCGVRTLKTGLKKPEIENKKQQLAEKLFQVIPAGLGSTGDIHLDKEEINEVIKHGAEFAVERGYGTKQDLEYTEENGKIEGAKPENISDKAKKRQYKQIGTLGSGNHYLEVQYVDKIFDEKAAKAYGIKENDTLASIHCGSRALGHQVGTDYLKVLKKASKKYDIKIREKELVCAPFKSEEGQKYFSAVKGAINTAFANRQALTGLTRQAFEKVYGDEKITQLYDVGHNTAKEEEHKVNGKKKDLVMHRKGATRAFGPGRKEIPKKYRKVGQPVLIGGTMGTSSYILKGTQKGMDETFGSSCHGAGRTMSRNQAKSEFWGETVQGKLKKQGIILKAHSKPGIAEEAPGAYKDVDRVVNISHETGIAERVARVKPIIVVKG